MCALKRARDTPHPTFSPWTVSPKQRQKIIRMTGPFEEISQLPDDWTWADTLVIGHKKTVEPVRVVYVCRQ